MDTFILGKWKINPTKPQNITFQNINKVDISQSNI